MSQFYTSVDHFVLLPAIMLALFGCAVLLFDFLIFPEPRQRKYLVLFVALGLVFTGVALWRQQHFLATRKLKGRLRDLHHLLLQITIFMKNGLKAHFYMKRWKSTMGA